MGIIDVERLAVGCAVVLGKIDEGGLVVLVGIDWVGVRVGLVVRVGLGSVPSSIDRTALVLGKVLIPRIVSRAGGVSLGVLGMLIAVEAVAVAVVVAPVQPALGFGSDKLSNVLLGFVSSVTRSSTPISTFGSTLRSTHISIRSSSSSISISSSSSVPATSEKGFWMLNLVIGLDIGVAIAIAGVHRLVRNDIGEHDGRRLGQQQDRRQKKHDNGATSALS